MDTQKPKSQTNMWKIILGILALVVLGYYGFSSYKASDDRVIVAISQIIEHDSLDEERKGIIKALIDAGYIEGKNLKIVYENAQGSMSTLAQIASKLVSLKPDVVVAISTPSAQSLAKLCKQYVIPLVFTAVTDPNGAKLTVDDKQSFEITGVSDHIPPEKHFTLMKHITPQLKRVGIIYNAGEANSVSQVAEIKQEAKKQEVELVIAIAMRTGDVSAAAEKLVGARVDCIYVPNDNTTVAAMESVVRAAIKGYVDESGERRSVPVVAGDSGSVRKGALATVGYRRDMLGYKAGKQVVQILQGEQASEIPIERGAEVVNMINVDTAEQMKLEISPAIMMGAVLIKKKVGATK